MLVRFAAVFGIATLTLACSSQSAETGEPVGRQPPVACTLIGCADGLEVQLRGNLPASYTVTARAGNDVRTRECSSSQPCDQIRFENFTPSSVTIEITHAGGTTRRELTPEYHESRPNGPDCPPVCRSATVTVEV